MSVITASEAVGMTGIDVGAGVFLVLEDDLLRHFERYGFTKKSFRDLCTALAVPMFVMPDGSRLVSLAAFQFAIGFVLRPGALSFKSPGAPGNDKDFTTEIDQRQVEKSWESVMSRLLAYSRLEFRKPSATAARFMRSGASQIAKNVAARHRKWQQEQSKTERQQFRKALEQTA